VGGRARLIQAAVAALLAGPSASATAPHEPHGSAKPYETAEEAGFA
jgi:hypothetical protein